MEAIQDQAQGEVLKSALGSWARIRIVMGGAPRTGSTLLRFALDRSESIIAGPETSFFIKPFGEQKIRAKQIAEKLDIDAEFVRKALLRNTSAVCAFDEIMAAYAISAERDPIGWAEKTPRNVHHYERLSELYPYLMFISTIRDGLDVVTSLHANPARNIRYHCSVERYVASMRDVYRFNRPNHTIVRYEDLVRDPRSTLTRLTNWIGIEFHPFMADSPADDAVTRKLTKVRQPKLANPIVPTWVGRWSEPEHAERVSDFLSNPEAVYWRERSGYGRL